MSNEVYNPTPEEAAKIVEALSGRLSQTSQSAAQRGVAGGVILPEMMGGAIAKRVRPGAINVYWVVDRSGSLYSQRLNVIKAMRVSHQYLLDEQNRDEVDYTINLAVLAFDDKASVILTPTPVANVDPNTFESYMPSGSTALLDAWMGSLVGEAGYNYQLFRSGAKAQFNLLTLFTDTYENSSTVYRETSYRNPPTEIAAMMADLRKTRDHVFSAINFGGERDYLTKMGFLDRNIVDLANFSPATIAQAFKKSSTSAVNISRQVSSGGSTAVESESADTAFDNAMFS